LILGAGVVIRDGMGADMGVVEMEMINCSPFVIGIEERYPLPRSGLGG
jgi:hypothetical protein